MNRHIKYKPQLSAAQRHSLAAIADGLYPSLPVPSNLPNQKDDATKRFWNTSGGDVETMLDTIDEAIHTKLSENDRGELKLLLSALSTIVGSAALIPAAPYTVAFVNRSSEEREAGLLALANSILGVRRKAFNGLKRLVLGTLMSHVDDSVTKADELNPFWQGLGYEGPPRLRPNNKDAEKLAEAAGTYTTIEEATLKISRDIALEYDCVVIGSGAGGGVASAQLSAKGYRVLVLEKSKYYNPKDMSQLEVEAIRDMYEKSGLLTTEDGHISILAGSTFGGGTSINWACCLDTPDYVRKEWSDKHGLKQFVSDSEFDEALAAVKSRIGVHSDGVSHNGANQLLLDSCASVGYKCQTAPQNLQDTASDSAGFTCFGDRYGNKQGTAKTYLVDAAKNGAKFIHECQVERILHESAPNGRRKAFGVLAYVGEEKHSLVITAKRCIVTSAGSLNSPLILKRSQFQNPHIGKHLKLHPVTAALGNFPGKDLRLWKGAPMTTVCKEFEMGPENDGYGAKLEIPSTHPGLMAASVPWHGGFSFKENANQASNNVAVIVLQRDKDSEGTVEVASDGIGPKVHYKVGPADRKSMIASLQGALKLLISQNPTRVGTMHQKIPMLQVPDSTADEIETYLNQVGNMDLSENSCGVFSAHQMCTNRMGSSPYTSVVDEDGELWECDGVYVCDASILPTASGSNPMMSTLAMSTMISTRLARLLALEDDKLTEGSTEYSQAMSTRERKLERRSQTVAYGSQRRLLTIVCTVILLSTLTIYSWHQYNANS